jgi:hypothetical protein
MRKERRVSLTNGKSRGRRSIVSIDEVIDILAKYGMDDIRALAAVMEVVQRMGYEMVDGEIIERVK